MNEIKDIEFESREAIQSFQEELLRKQIAFLAERSPYYRQLFKEQQIAPESIRTLADLKRLPFTEKKDLQLLDVGKLDTLEQAESFLTTVPSAG